MQMTVDIGRTTV